MTKKSIFIDTGVLVAAATYKAPFHLQCIGALGQVEAAHEGAWISRQVVRELLATLSRPQVWGASFDGALLAAYVQRLLEIYRIAEEDANASQRLLAYVKDGRALGKQVHDAAIASTMLSHGIKRILTLNTGHFERFRPDITVEAPEN